MAQLYAKKTSDGRPKALECTDEGLLKVDTELTATIDPTGLATEATLADLLAKIIAAPSTEANQDLILTALGLIATEATAGDIKTATEALAALISAGALAVSLAELPDTAAGDMADINTASASIDGTLGDMATDLGTVQTDLATVKADIALIKADLAKILEKVQLHVAIDFSSASAQTIIAAPGAGNRIRLTRLSLSSGGTPQVNVEVALKSGSTAIETVKGNAMVFDYPEHRNLGTNEAFVVQCTTADRVIGGVDYYVEAA